MFECTHSGVRTVSPGHHLPWSYRQDLVHGEVTCLSEAGPTGCCSGGTLDKPSSGYCLGIVLGWAPICVAVMATPTSQYYFGHAESYLILSIRCHGERMWNENSTAVSVLLTSSDGLFTQSFPHWNGSPHGSLTIETNWSRINYCSWTE